MICLPKITHLICDLSLGGVTKNLEIFESDLLRAKFSSKIMPIKTEWKIAPYFDADIIITHFSPSWANLPFLYSLRKRNASAKIIHMEHSYSPEWEAHCVSDFNRFRKMLKLSYSLFDQIICVSKTQFKWIESMGAAAADKLHIINPWSEVAPLLKLEPPKFDDDKIMIIGSYGRLVKEKGFEDLIQSYLKMPYQDKINLLIGGYGPDAEYLKNLTSGHPNIKFYGKVDNIANFMQHCDIIAVPSYYETFGLVATEGRAAGRPILVSPVGSLVEQMGNSGQVINFKQHESAAQILSHIKRLPLTKMSQDARQSCERLKLQRIASWSQLLNQILFEEKLINKAA